MDEDLKLRVPSDAGAAAMAAFAELELVQHGRRLRDLYNRQHQAA